MENNTLDYETTMLELQTELDDLIAAHGTWDDGALILPWAVESRVDAIEAEMERLRADQLSHP
jgi:hypothetical protein